MLNYRNTHHDLTRSQRFRRGGSRVLLPIVWFVVGLTLLAALVLFWIMPVGFGVDSLAWLGRSLGINTGGGGLGYNPFGGIGVGTQGLATVLPLLLAVMAMAAFGAAMNVYRRRTAVAVLGHLASAVHLRVPLPPYLRAAANGERRLLRKRLIRLAYDLSGGRSIGDALADAAGELPPLTIDRIAAAERSFALGDATALVLQRERQRASLPNPAGGSRAYTLVLVTTLLFVVSMVTIFVIPKYAQIFADFKVRLPPVTMALVRFARNPFYFSLPTEVTSLVLVFIALPGLFVVFCVTVTRLARAVFTSRPVRPLYLPLADRVIWYTPFFGRITRDRHAAVACEALAEALLVGRPLPDAIGSATLPNLNAVLRRRMRAWQTRVTAGEPPAAAARASGLPAIWCDLMAGAQSDLASAVAFAGRAYAASWQRRAAVVQAVTPVVLTLLAATAVAFVALALLVPMTTLMESIPASYSRRW